MTSRRCLVFFGMLVVGGCMWVWRADATCFTKCDDIVFFTTRTSPTSAGDNYAVVDPSDHTTRMTCSRTWRTDNNFLNDGSGSVTREKRPVDCDELSYICFASGSYYGKIGCNDDGTYAGDPSDLSGCTNYCQVPAP